MSELHVYRMISSILLFGVGLHAVSVVDETNVLKEELRYIRNSFKVLVHRIDELEKANQILQKSGCLGDHIGKTSDKNNDYINPHQNNNTKEESDSETLHGVKECKTVVSNQIKRRSVSVKVAFRAYVTGPISNLGDNQIIPFTSVPFDTHKAFHGDSGVFTSPKSGLYVFFCTILVYYEQRLEFEIVKDGYILAYGGSYGNKAEHKDYGSGTTSTIVQLNAGENVYVRVHGNIHPPSGQIIFQGIDDLEETNAILQICGCPKKHLRKTLNKNAEFKDPRESDSRHIDSGSRTLHIVKENAKVSNKIKRLYVPVGVAFRAGVSKITSYLGDNQIIPFRTVRLDTHKAFHIDNAFFCTMVVFPSKKIEFEIVKGSHIITWGESYGKGADQGQLQH
ncbi:unnamed protein product [Mytilus coruscus]|uniref:C1q domain-containing protein n=1 Tax=Mytilus coruscus TaxID=42192 RepID=A0A6J8DEN5_MYTCO|nr:unnamed protein product [Mytilus coruscus]